MQGDNRIFTDQRDIFWQEWRLNPHSTAYNVALAYELKGPVDERRLTDSIALLIGNHDIFRVVFCENHDGVKVHLLDNLEKSIEIVDLSRSESVKDALAVQIEKIRQHQFDLEQGPLFRIALIKADDDHYFLVLCFHHIIVDGSSERYIMNYISAAYNQQPLPNHVLSLSCYLKAKDSIRSSVQDSVSHCFWEKQVAMIDPQGNDFNTIKSKQSINNKKSGHFIYFNLDAKLVKKLQQRIEDSKSSWFCLLMTAYLVVLHRLTGCNQLTVCYAANVRSKDFVKALGCFINVLPFVALLKDKMTFSELFNEVTEVRSQQKQYQHYPFLAIVETLRKTQESDIQSALSVGLMQTHVKTMGLNLNDLSVTTITETNNQVIYDLCLEYEFIEGKIQCRLNYRDDYFDKSVMTHFQDGFQQTLSAILTSPEQEIHTFSLLNQQEKQKILIDWNASDAKISKAQLLPAIIAEHALENPENPALAFGNLSLSYSEIESRTTLVASYLHQHAVNQSAMIPIVLPRGIDRIVAMLSILKSGFAYVPIDPNYPPHRIAAILEDCKPTQLMTSTDFLGKINKALTIAKLKEVDVCFIENFEEKKEAVKPLPDIKPNDLAYVLYTSGSTGVPKGVKISHGSLLNFLYAMKTLLAVSPDDYFVNLTPYSFDISGLEIYLPLLVGSCCVIPTERVAQNGELLSALLDHYPIQFVQTTPTNWRLLFDTGWNTRKKPTLLCGGEALPISLVDDLLSKGRQVWNMYGPTETTIWSTAYLVKDKSKTLLSVPIGRPIANTKVYVLDHHQQPVPIGCIGELYIGGQGVALGYLNRDDLTEDRFIIKPAFLEETSCASKGREQKTVSLLYKTGDLVKWMSDGNLIYLGRRDQLIKHHGNRIELGDIESAILTHSNINQIIVVRKKETQSEQYSLIAYYTLKNKIAGLSEDDLRNYLIERLPIHFIPNRFVLLENIPMTSSGKVDRQALMRTAVPMLEKQNAFMAEVESILSKIWRDSLDVSHVASESNFFFLGGDSLSAIRIAYIIEKEFAIECSARDVFNHPTISQLSSWIEAQNKLIMNSRTNIIKKEERIYPLPLSSAQKRFWFLSMLTSADSYNVLLAWKLTGAINIDYLTRAINTIIEHYEIFRTIYVKEEGEVYQKICDFYPINITIEEIDESEKNSTIENENKYLFSLDEEPPLRVRVLCVENQYYILLVNMHHILFDEKTLDLFVKKISEYYAQISINKSIPYPLEEIQYADYACWERKYIQNKNNGNAAYYWRDLLSECTALNLPVDYPRRSDSVHRAKCYDFKVKGEQLKALRDISQSAQATLFSTFLSIIYVLLQKYTNNSDLIIGVPVSIRNFKALDLAMGCFINTLPLRYRIPESISFIGMLGQIKKMLLAALHHKDISFDKLTNILKSVRTFKNSTIISVLVTWEDGGDKSALRFPEAKAEKIEVPTLSSRANLHFNFVENADVILCKIEYDSSLYKTKSIEDLANYFSKLLVMLSNKPDQLISEIFLENKYKKEIYNRDNASKQVVKRKIKESFPHNPILLKSNSMVKNKLKEIFENILNVEIHNLDESLFNLGINSLLLINAKNEIEKKFNKEIELIDFFKHPSITAIADFLLNLDITIQASEKQDSIANNDDQNDVNDIAIIGFSGQFPGAKTADQFWENIIQRKESITHFTGEALKCSDITAEQISDSRYVCSRGVIEEAEYFDAQFFNFSPNEAVLTDPQHRLFIEHAWTVLESAGYSPKKYKGSIGVYAGSDESGYLSKSLRGDASYLSTTNDFQKLIGNNMGFLSTKVSYKLNLTGPSLNINTACSTGLVVVASACDQLLSKQCDMAIAGSISIKQPQKTGYLYQPEGIVSPDGHCRAFSSGSAGTVPSGGVGVVLLKRLEDALHDRDPIQAVIKGYHINNDGSEKIGYTAPSVKQQALCIEEALKKAKVSADTLHYIEAHGTGTKLGDPIEIEALNKAFQKSTNQKQFCAVGSVKSNIGHADAASGMAGLIKVVQAIKNKTIPPTLYCENTNDSIDFKNSAFYVNRKVLPWASNNRPRRAGVNSLGLGGTNSFLVLEEAPLITKKSRSNTTKSEYYILPFSAKSFTALKALIKNFYSYISHLDITCIDNESEFLANLAYTLQIGRAEFKYREALIVRSLSELIEQLESNLEKLSKKKQADFAIPESEVVFFFPGQGSQYQNMGYSLYQLEPVFKSAVDQCADTLLRYLKMDIRDILFSKEKGELSSNDLINQTRYTQPALFCIEYALAKLWESWGIEPAVLIGHSFGEYVAAYIAGIFNLEDVLRLIVYRSELIDRLDSGVMLMLGLPSNRIEPFLNDELSLASISSPTVCVVSGSKKRIQWLEKRLVSDNILDKRKMQILNTSHAFHSKMMQEIVPDFVDFLKKIEMKEPKVPIVSNVTGRFSQHTNMSTPEYWAEQLVGTIQFSKNIKTILESLENPLFMTLGPSRELSSLVNAHHSSHAGISYINTIRSVKEYELNKIDGARIAYQALAKIWLADKNICWENLASNQNAYRLVLPTYPFERKRYWPDSQAKRTVPAENSDTIDDWFYKPTWQRMEPLNLTTLDGNIDDPTVCWIIFYDEKLSSQVLKYLNNFLDNVILVSIDEQYHRKSDREYTINPGIEEHYDILLKSILSSVFKKYHILDFWSYDVTQSSTNLESILNKGFYHLFYLSKWFSNIASSQELHVVSVVSKLFSVFLEDTVCPVKAAILGASQVIPFELPNIKIKCVDVGVISTSDLMEISNQIIYETNSSMNVYDQNDIAYRQGYRWVRSFIKTKLSHSQKDNFLKRKGVYVIVGGLGGIGLEIAERFIVNYKLNVVLLSRKKLPQKELWGDWLQNHTSNDEYYKLIERLYSIQSRGENFNILDADVSSAVSMKKAVETISKKIGAIRGVIHAAGIPGAGLILNKSRSMVEDTLASKLQGAYVLSELFRKIPLDFIMFFSSITSITGGIGQIDYCAANACLDSLPETNLFHKNTRVMVLNWNKWRDTGMTNFPDKFIKNANLPALYQAVIDNNSISAEQGCELLFKAFSSRENHLIISKMNLSDYKNQLFSKAREIIKSPSKGINKDILSSSKTTLDCFTSIIKNILGVKFVNMEEDFFELGGHSLVALQLLEEIRQSFNVALSIPDIYKARRLSDLYDLIISKKTNKFSSSFLIPMKIEGDGPPLFLIHPVGGTIFCYMDLVNQLKYEGAIYAIQDPGLTSKNYQFPTLEEMAAFYLTRIQKLYPNGPYLLAGFSLGGTIAFEIARQLHASDYPVQYLGLIDSWAIFSDFYYNKSSFEVTMRRQLNHFKSTLEKAGLSDFKSLLPCQLSRMRLLERYRPQSLDLKIHLYKAFELLPQYVSIEDKYNHWNQYTSIGVKANIIPGSHETILIKSNVNSLAKFLQQDLLLKIYSEEYV